jgi:hypothetical protein
MEIYNIVALLFLLLIVIMYVKHSRKYEFYMTSGK